MAEKRESFLGGTFLDLQNLIELMDQGITTHGLNFGLSEEEIADFKTLLASVGTDHTEANVARAAGKTATEKFQVTEKTAKKEIRAMAKRFKAHPKYTTIIGEDMGIIGKEVHYDPAVMKPKLKVTIVAEKASIAFVKSYSEGIALYSKREGDADFEFLARDSSSPYVDIRTNLEPGKPELRQYRALYLFDDKETGLVSGIVEIYV